MDDNTVVLLTRTWEEAWDVYEGDERDVEGVTEADEASSLTRSVAVEGTCHDHRLVSDDTDALTVEASEADDDVLSPVTVYFEELTVVDDRTDDIVHIVALVRLVRDDRVEDIVDAVYYVRRLYARSILHVVLGDEGEQVTDQADTFLFIVYSEVSDTTLGGMYAGTTELLLGNVFTRDGLDDLGAREEHIARTLAHNVEVSKSRRVNGTTSTRTEDSGDLGDHTRSQDVVLEDVTIAAESVDTFLNTGTTRVVKADDRSTHLHSELHDLTDLRSQHFGECTTEDGEVLCKDIDQTTVDRTGPGDDTVTEELRLVDTEVRRAVQDEGVDFVEATFVKEEGDTLASGELTLLVLAVDTLLTATDVGLSAELNKLLDFL